MESLLLGVGAANGLGNGRSATTESQAALVEAGLLDADVDPDAPGTARTVGTGDEIGALELEVASAVDGPALGLSVLRERPISRVGVAHHALAHAGAVDVNLLRIGSMVEPELTGGAESESGLVIVVGFGVADGALGG